MALSASRVVERCAYGLVSDAEGTREMQEARDVLRLAVGLRRMLERQHTTAQAAGPQAPAGRKEA